MTRDIKPIRNDADHAEALAAIEGLWQGAPGTPEHDRLEVLAMLVDDYERRRWPIAPADPVELITYVMEQRGLTRKDLEAALGARARVSEILNRRRPLTMKIAGQELNMPPLASTERDRAQLGAIVPTSLMRLAGSGFEVAVVLTLPDAPLRSAPALDHRPRGRRRSRPRRHRRSRAPFPSGVRPTAEHPGRPDITAM